MKIYYVNKGASNFLQETVVAYNYLYMSIPLQQQPMRRKTETSGTYKHFEMLAA
jgi:hypothetical protein